MNVKWVIQMHEIIHLFKNVFWRTGLSKGTVVGPGDKERISNVPILMELIIYWKDRQKQRNKSIY